MRKDFLSGDVLNIYKVSPKNNNYIKKYITVKQKATNMLFLLHCALKSSKDANKYYQINLQEKKSLVLLRNI